MVAHTLVKVPRGKQWKPTFNQMYTAARFGQKVYRSYTRSKQKKHGRYGVGVTNQYDRTNVYRKRRMPRRKRKRWVGFVKKVRAAENTTLGTRTRVFNDRLQLSQVSPPAPANRVQLFSSIGLYTNNGTRSSCDKDLNKIVNEDPDIKNTTSIGMISGIMDMTLVNKSIDAEGNPMGIELDVYFLTARKRFTDVKASGDVVADNLEDVLRQGLVQSEGIGGIGKLDVNDLGVTPFDCTLALSSFGIKILNKKKYFLPFGNQMTYQMRDPKNRRFSRDQVINCLGQNYPGSSKFLLLIAKGLPGAANVGTSYAVNLDIGITRKYAYKINEDSTDKSG